MPRLVPLNTRISPGTQDSDEPVPIFLSIEWAVHNVRRAAAVTVQNGMRYAHQRVRRPKRRVDVGVEASQLQQMISMRAIFAVE